MLTRGKPVEKTAAAAVKQEENQATVNGVSFTSEGPIPAEPAKTTTSSKPKTKKNKKAQVATPDP